MDDVRITAVADISVCKLAAHDTIAVSSAGTAD